MYYSKNWSSLQYTPETENGLQKPPQPLRGLMGPRAIRDRKGPRPFSFSDIHTPDSLNQDQGSVFKLRECAQSIPRIKLALIGLFLKKCFRSKKHIKSPKFRFFIHPINKF